jgi:hypothetical protein
MLPKITGSGGIARCVHLANLRWCEEHVGVCASFTSLVYLVEMFGCAHWFEGGRSVRGFELLDLTPLRLDLGFERS